MWAKLDALLAQLFADCHYQKPMKPLPSRKLDKKVPSSTASPPLPQRLPHRAGYSRLPDAGQRR